MKFLVLSCSTGEGHNSAAKAICEVLESRDEYCEYIDVLKFNSEKASRRAAGVYLGLARHAPYAFGAVYHLGVAYSATKVRSPIYLTNRSYAKNLLEYIDGNGFDAVITSHLFAMEALTYLRRKGILKAKTYGILTDYTCIPFLEETDLDGYFIPHEDLRDECVKHGVPNDKIFSSGIPVSPQFNTHMPKDVARTLLGISTGGRKYMVMTGGIGCGNVLKLSLDILREDGGKDTEVYVFCGKNEKLYAEITAKYADNDQIKPVAFTDKISLYMNAADVLVSKPGGISSTEAAIVNVPLVHTLSIPGCETKNAKFFEAHGMSIYANSAKEAASAAVALASDEEAKESMLASQKQQINPSPSDDAVDIILGGLRG